MGVELDLQNVGVDDSWLLKQCACRCYIPPRHKIIHKLICLCDWSEDGTRTERTR